MKTLPEIRYARAESVSIAYSRWGQGDHLVVFTPPLVSNIELMWELPEWERMLTWAGQHHQIIMIDKRGVGLSDRVSEPSTLKEYVADVLAVMTAQSHSRGPGVHHVASMIDLVRRARQRISGEQPREISWARRPDRGKTSL